MKNILITLLLVGAFASSNAQQIPQLNGQIMPSHPIVIVDSVPMEFNTLKVLDTALIKSMNVVNNSYPGIVYITLKDHNSIKNLTRAKKLSLKQLTDAHVAKADKRRPIIYLMDHVLVTDTTGIRIPTEKFYSIQVIKAADTPYLKQAFPDALLLTVSTMIYVR
jgi:hypothetical protein